MDCKKLQVHRYRDMISIEANGISLYLNAAMCHMLAKTLNDGAFSLVTEKEFSKSNFPDTTLQTN